MDRLGGRSLLTPLMISTITGDMASLIATRTGGDDDDSDWSAAVHYNRCGHHLGHAPKSLRLVKPIERGMQMLWLKIALAVSFVLFLYIWSCCKTAGDVDNSMPLRIQRWFRAAIYERISGWFTKHHPRYARYVFLDDCWTNRLDPHHPLCPQQLWPSDNSNPFPCWSLRLTRAFFFDTID